MALSSSFLTTRRFPKGKHPLSCSDRTRQGAVRLAVCGVWWFHWWVVFEPVREGGRERV